MNVLYVAHYFSPNSAAGVTTREIIKMLSERGHEVTLLVPSTYASNGSNAKLKAAFTGAPMWVAQQSKLTSLAVSTLGCVSVFLTGLGLIRKEGPFNVIIVQYHATHAASLVSYVFSKIVKVPLIIKIHDFVPASATRNMIELMYTRMLSEMSKVALTHASVILSPSTEITHLLVETSKLNQAKIVIFPNSVSRKPTHSSQSPKQIRGFSKEGKTLLWVGETVGRGLEVLLKALSLIQNEKVTLIVIGKHEENNVRLTKQLGVAERVHFLGEVKHDLVERFIDRADVCFGPLTATPYTYGMIPRKVLESMARGKPVIAGKNTVTKDLAVDGTSALLVDSNNEKQVASAITLLLHDDALSAKMGKEAQTIVAEKFISEKLRERLNEMLKSVCPPNGIVKFCER